MKHAAYTIMQRRHFYAGTLNVSHLRAWHPVEIIPGMDGKEAVEAKPFGDGTAARQTCEYLSNYCTAELSHGEYCAPDYGYVLPSGKVRMCA
jgi:hypothetical protein